MIQEIDIVADVLNQMKFKDVEKGFIIDRIETLVICMDPHPSKIYETKELLMRTMIGQSAPIKKYGITMKQPPENLTLEKAFIWRLNELETMLRKVIE